LQAGRPCHAPRHRNGVSQNVKQYRSAATALTGIVKTIERRIVFVLGVIALAVVIKLCVRPAGAVSLICRSLDSNRETVILEFTNATRRTISYYGTTRQPDLSWMTLTPQGWRPLEKLYPMWDSLRPRTLAPSEGIVFEVPVIVTPCKLQLTYSDPRATNRVWRMLPSYLLSHLPWLRQKHTLETPVINLKPHALKSSHPQ
jgi:hypothetical protein